MLRPIAGVTAFVLQASVLAANSSPPPDRPWTLRGDFTVNTASDPLPGDAVLAVSLGRRLGRHLAVEAMAGPGLPSTMLARDAESVRRIQPKDWGTISATNLAVALPSGTSPALLALCLVTAGALLPWALRAAGAARAVRPGDTWGCGRATQTARMEYTSTAFAEPLRRVFADLYRPTKDLSIDFHPESKYFVRSIQYRSRIRTWFQDGLYRPLIEVGRALAGTGRVIQSGSLHVYITYIVAALLLLLLLARWL